MRALRRAHPGWFELAMFAVAYATYFGVRALTRGDISRALANSVDILRLERRLDLDWEAAVQGVVIGRGGMVDAVNAVYVWGHWPLLIVGGFLLFHLRRREYRRLRTVILVSGGLGLVAFGLFPVAPPRLAAIGLQDTVALHATTYHSIMLPSLVNEYAAMPSFHAGWNLLLGIELFRVSRSVLVRAFAVAAPATMAFAVVATANHFVLDVVGGAVAVIVPLVALSWLDPYSAQPGLGAAGTIRRGRRCGKPATAGVPNPDAPAVTGFETRAMFSSPTTYRSGSRTVEVLPGESHSAAWAYITRGGPEPSSYTRVSRADGCQVRRRDHASRRRRTRCRGAPASIA